MKTILSQKVKEAMAKASDRLVKQAQNRPPVTIKASELFGGDSKIHDKVGCGCGKRHE